MTNPQEHPGAWTPKHVVWGILALSVLLLIEGALVVPFDPDLDSLAATLVVQLMLAATLVGIAFGFATLPGSGLARPSWLGLRRVRFEVAWEAIAIGVFAYLVFAGVYSEFVHAHQEDVARDLGYGSSAFGAIAAGALIVVAAPFSEEVFFRGFVFGGLRHRLPFWPAAIVAGTLFGLVHYTGVSSIGVLPQLAVLGLILCWIYERTGSIWPTIAVHVLNNLLAFIFIAS
jgi:membrane protease YdiL (CAAX protease family)